MTFTIDLPDEITFDQVKAAIAALGISDTVRLTSVYMDVRTVELRGMAGDTEFSHRYHVAPSERRRVVTTEHDGGGLTIRAVDETAAS